MLTLQDHKSEYQFLLLASIVIHLFSWHLAFIVFTVGLPSLFNTPLRLRVNVSLLAKRDRENYNNFLNNLDRK